MSLAVLVSHDRWQDFDRAWQECIASGGTVDELLAALSLVGDKNRVSRCVAKAREHAALLEDQGRHADAARLLGAVLVAGGNPSELQADLGRLSRLAWADEPWWSSYAELTGLTDGTDLRAAWKSFAKLIAYQPGTYVMHPGGWGAGEVMEVKPEARAIVVRFQNGRTDTFPMNAAIEIFEPLPENDLRAQSYRDPEGLRRRAKKEPLETLRSILERYHGRATSVVIKNAMLQIGIEGSSWSAWWRKARKLAENSSWFDVTGSTQKAVVRLLLAEKDPVEGLRRQILQTEDLADVHARVRDLFIGDKAEPELRAAALELLEERAAVDSEPIEERVAAWLLLREQRGTTPPALTETLAELKAAEVPTDPSVPPELWRVLRALPSSRDQERSVDVLQEVYGDAWLDEVLRHLQHAPPGAVRLLVDAVRAADRLYELLDHYGALLARPLRAPTLLVTLARIFEAKDLQREELPTPPQRAQALLNLATYLFQNRRGNPHWTRVHNRLVDLLTGGPKPLLRRLLVEMDTAGLRSLQLVLHRGVDDAVDHLVTDIALEHDRHFFASQAAPFWASDTIWTTRAGLERRSSELRHLREVLIPENQDAIGRAASYGDLSENAEWESAIEEQRNLTDRARQIEQELQRADLIENAALLEDTVCPGTIVRYRELADGSEHGIVVLGPWDDAQRDGEQVVSYRAPLAAGLLGLHTGDRAVLQVPSGEVEIEVLEIQTTSVD